MIRSSLGLGLGLLAACSQGGGEAQAQTAETTSTATMPSIHLVQTVVMLEGGAPQEETVYRQALATCQHSGMATKAIPDDQVARIGRRRIESWLGSDRQARHTESWHQDMASACQFVMRHEDHMEINQADGRAYDLDLDARTGQVQSTGPAQAPVPVDGDDGKLDDASRQAGWSVPGKDQNNGQSCLIWKSPAGDQACVWSGGGKWGFSADGKALAGSDGQPGSGGAIVLWAKPARGTGWQVDTEQMSVGQPMDEQPFKVPANVSVSAAP